MILSKSFKKRAAAVAVTFALATSMVGMSAGDALAVSGNLKIGGSSTVGPLAQLMVNTFKASNKGFTASVTINSSGLGRSGAMDGTYNIGMSSASWTSPAGLYPTQVARDALTFVVNPSNKVKKLTKTQLKQIWTGQISNWKQVGGANHKIDVCGRAAGSGTGDYVNKDIFGSPTLVGTIKTYNTNGDLKNAVVKDKYAVGYVGMAYAASKVRGLAVNGVAPTRANAKAGKYPFVRPLFWCTNGAPTGLSKSFIDWSVGSKGQAVANKLYMSNK
jgi:phosphate transport system substrate-binding protein